MELVYRALWRDDRLNPEVSVMEIFDKWSGSSKVETLNASGDGQLQVVEMRSNSSEERRTTIRIISQREDRFVWVDVEDFSIIVVARLRGGAPSHISLPYLTYSRSLAHIFVEPILHIRGAHLTYARSLSYLFSVFQP